MIRAREKCVWDTAPPMIEMLIDDSENDFITITYTRISFGELDRNID